LLIVPFDYFYNQGYKETSEGIESYLSDHLGSTFLMVDENGLEVECTDYFPKARFRYAVWRNTGLQGRKMMVIQANTLRWLMYYGARYYSPEYMMFVCIPVPNSTKLVQGIILLST